MRDILTDIRAKLSAGLYTNEEHVRLSLVARILQGLGWDIWSPAEVNTEFAVVPDEDRSKVDIALFPNPRHPAVFIEVKAVGKIGNALQNIEQQVRDYNRDNVALVSVITDGRNWRFYFSQAPGKFGEKCFMEFDLARGDPADVIESLTQFLSKPMLLDGSAERKAREFLNLNQKQRVMSQCLPEARRLAMAWPCPALPDALVRLVAEQGMAVSREEVESFLRKPPPPVKPLGDVGPPGNTKDADNPPDLLNSRVTQASFAGRRATKWTFLVKEAVKAAVEGGLDSKQISEITRVEVKQGSRREKAFSQVREAGVTFRFQNANGCWRAALALAKQLRVPVDAEFEWNKKAAPDIAGKRGRLRWEPPA